MQSRLPKSGAHSAAMALAFGVLVALSAPASAQSFATGQPEWVRVLLAADMHPSAVAPNPTPAPAGGVAARLTILPPEGGVARVIRYTSAASGARLSVLRFTGHLRTGWSQWGADQAVPVTVDASAAAELDRLLRGALSAARFGGEPRQSGAPTCASGVLGYLEASDGTTTTTFERRCILDGQAGGAIAALSKAAGSEDEEALHEAGLKELMDADRAFFAAAQDKGVPGAFVDFAHEEATLFFPGREPFVGKAGVRERFSRWPAGAKLTWTPEGAEIAARGDMGWTWGRGVYIAPDGKQFPSLYTTVWRRDFDGNWRFVSNMGIDGPAAASPASPPAPSPPPAAPPAPIRPGDGLRR